MWGRAERQAQADDPALLVPLGAGEPVERSPRLLRRLAGGGGDLLRRCRLGPGQQIERRWNDSRPFRQTEDGTWVVGVAPVLYDLAARDVEYVDSGHLHPFARRSDALELAQVGATHGHAGRDLIALGDQVLDGDAHVGEGRAHLAGKLLEGVEELDLSVFFGYGGAFVIERVGVDDLVRQVEVARGDDLVDLPRDGLDLFRHRVCSFPTLPRGLGASLTSYA